MDEKNALSLKVDVDTKEANENIRELTTAANECVEALERLEKLMLNFDRKQDELTCYPIFKTSCGDELGREVVKKLYSEGKRD